jgi:hypothetical protein
MSKDAKEHRAVIYSWQEETPESKSEFQIVYETWYICFSRTVNHVLEMISNDGISGLLKEISTLLVCILN